MWDNIIVENSIGSEDGIVLRDEEYANSCRITLEKCPKRYAITCGVYGSMVHTVFCGEDFENIYEAMKKELKEFIDRGDTTEEENTQFYDYFTNKF